MELPLMLAVSRVRFLEKVVSGDKTAQAFMAGGIVLWIILAFWIGAFTGLAHAALERFGAIWTAALIPFFWMGLEYFRSELYQLRFAWILPGQVVSFLPSARFLLPWLGGPAPCPPHKRCVSELRRSVAPLVHLLGRVGAVRFHSFANPPRQSADAPVLVPPALFARRPCVPEDTSRWKLPGR